MSADYSSEERCRPLLYAVRDCFPDDKMSFVDDEDLVERYNRQWTLALSGWERLTRHLENPAALQRLRAFLSDDEWQAHRVLSDWSNMVYCDVGMSLWHTIAAIMNGNLEPGRPAGYRAQMVRLFRAEFTDPIWFWCEAPWENDHNPEHASIRQHSIHRAYIQQRGFELLSLGPLGPEDWETFSRESQSGEQHLSGPLFKFEGRVESPLINELPLQTVRTSSMELPHYLWDMAAGTCVETQHLEGTIAYTAISHTWGRWVISSPVDIPGVPWRVPQNSRFDVRQLATMLRTSPCQTPYIWIDLFCIPQGDRQDSSIAKQEIARQGQVFRNARKVFAWLTDVSMSFCVLDAVLEVMLLDVVELSVNGPVARIADEIRRPLRQWLTDPFLKIHLYSYENDGTLNSWFTSLWTLQEAFLRPDMRLYNLGWEPVYMRPRWQPDLLSIVILVDCWSREAYDTSLNAKEDSGADDPDTRTSTVLNDVPSNLRDTPLTTAHVWLHLTALSVLIDPSPPRLLAAGDRRVCTSRRAEAIMSAIGAVNWFEELPYERHEENLVLGKYPLAFVREVMSLDPPAFFRSVITSFDSYEMASAPELSHCPPDRMGTMLPFTADEEFNAFRSTWGAGDGHLSVWGWIIEEQGHVYMRTASILASNRLPDIPPISEKITFTSDSFNSTTDVSKTPTPLVEWTRSRPFEVHFVVVQCERALVYSGSSRPTTIECVVIARDDTDRLVSIGWCKVKIPFEVKCELPEDRQVDWRIA